MAGLEGTINTPIGTVPKKTALILAGGAVMIAGIIFYRQKQMAADSTPAVTDGEINPATGYVYGSPEDAAALASQNSYVSPPANSGGGGGSSIPNSNVGYTSNGQWTQATIELMTNNGSISDPSALSAALGKYVTGAYVASDDANTNSLIQQAIAVNGYPPIAGPTGYPPSINRTPPTSGGTTPPPPPSGNTNPPPKPTPKPAPKPAPKPKYKAKYTVRGGDNLWNIAIHFYGNGASYGKIFAENKKGHKRLDGSIGMISKPDHIEPGWVLIIP